MSSYFRATLFYLYAVPGGSSLATIKVLSPLNPGLIRSSGIRSARRRNSPYCAIRHNTRCYFGFATLGRLPVAKPGVLQMGTLLGYVQQAWAQESGVLSPALLPILVASL
jgi:hypothetical protein